jgi:cystathionine gamma-lyase
MEASQKNAMAIAIFLENHDKVESVIYPGLISHPQHEIAKRQAKGFGSMITFFIKGNIEQSHSFLSNLKLFILAESLGAVESLAESPACMTHLSVPPGERIKLGISDNLIRLSIGIENPIDLIEDLLQALNNMK